MDHRVPIEMFRCFRNTLLVLKWPNASLIRTTLFSIALRRFSSSSILYFAFQTHLGIKQVTKKHMKGIKCTSKSKQGSQEDVWNKGLSETVFFEFTYRDIWTGANSKTVSGIGRVNCVTVSIQLSLLILIRLKYIKFFFLFLFRKF